MTSHFIKGFLPSTSGLRFENDFPKAPVITVDFPLIGERGFGDASGGLCGGMVFTVNDYFEAGLAPPADVEPPLPGTSLFEYLCRRLMASFNLPLGALKYYEWMNLPDEDQFLARGISFHTIEKEWPGIQQQLDANHPAPLGLVTVQSRNPEDLGECHQVLAYGYEWKENLDLRVFVYDPNMPGRDDIVLALNTGNSATGSPITFTSGNPVRGFFLTPYSSPAEPFP